MLALRLGDEARVRVCLDQASSLAQHDDPSTELLRECAAAMLRCDSDWYDARVKQRARRLGGPVHELIGLLCRRSQGQLAYY